MGQNRILYSGAASGPEAGAVEALPPELKCEAVGGADALAKALLDGSCGLLLCDLAAARGLLERRALLAPEVPVVALAGVMDREAEAGLVRSGADACLYGDRLALLPVVVSALLEKRAARTLRSRERTLEAEGRVCSALVHDFNNILGAIEGYATLNLRQLPAGDPLRGDLEEIRKAVAKAAALTKQLLVFGRRHAVNKVSVGIPLLISGLRERIDRLTGAEFRLETDLRPGLPDIMADPSQLEQLLLSFLSNARDAMPAGGTITLRAEALAPEQPALRVPDPAAAGFVKISVADTGTGMPPEAEARLFEPFFSTKGKGKGVGLALAAAYGIARQHGGWIEAKTSEGRGSEFSVFLPAAAGTGRQ